MTTKVFVIYELNGLPEPPEETSAKTLSAWISAVTAELRRNLIGHKKIVAAYTYQATAERFVAIKRHNQRQGVVDSRLRWKIDEIELDPCLPIMHNISINAEAIARADFGPTNNEEKTDGE